MKRFYRLRNQGNCLHKSILALLMFNLCDSSTYSGSLCQDLLFLK